MDNYIIKATYILEEYPRNFATYAYLLSYLIFIYEFCIFVTDILQITCDNLN